MPSGFPGGSVVGSLPASVGDVGFDSWSGRIPRALEQPSPWATTTEPVFWSPGAEERVGQFSSVGALQPEASTFPCSLTSVSWASTGCGDKGWLLSALERLKGLKDGRGCGLDRANGLSRRGDIGAGVGGRGCFPLEKSRSASWKRWHFTGVVSCWWTSGHERGSQNSGWPAYAGRSAPAERVTCAVSFISCKCGHRRRAELLQSCPTLRSHGLSPATFLCSWDFPRLPEWVVPSARGSS